MRKVKLRTVVTLGGDRLRRGLWQRAHTRFLRRWQGSGPGLWHMGLGFIIILQVVCTCLKPLLVWLFYNFKKEKSEAQAQRRKRSGVVFFLKCELLMSVSLDGDSLSSLHLWTQDCQSCGSSSSWNPRLRDKRLSGVTILAERCVVSCNVLLGDKVETQTETSKPSAERVCL